MGVTYVKYSFQKPPAISDSNYKAIRDAIKRNPNVEIISPATPFKEQFKGYIKVIKICGCVLAAALVLSAPFELSENANEWGKQGFGYFLTSIIGLGGGLAMVVAMWVLWYLANEGSSYSDYVNDRKDYYKKMKHIISTTETYEEFQRSFYN